MTIALFPADNAGCGSYRLIWPGEAMARIGYDIDNRGDDYKISALMRSSPYGPLPVRLLEPPEFDIAVVQRPSRPAMQYLVGLWRNAGVEIVVDLDDNFMRVDPRNTTWKRYHAEGKNWDGIKAVLSLCDRAVFSTEELAEAYAPWVGGESYVRHNCLPPEAYATEPKQGPPRTFGWTGHVGNHPTDLQQLGDSVRRLLRDGTFDAFVQIGDPDHVNRILGIEAEQPGGQRLPEYFTQISKIDVGLVPLDDIAFNHSKSYLKGLEYMARGIPPVATAMPAYRLLDGCTLVERKKDWRKKILEVVENYDELAARAFQLAADHHIDKHAEAWGEAWTGKSRI